MSAKSTADSKFASLEKEFFDGWMDRNPVLAVRLGIEKYRTQLPDSSRKSKEGDIKFLLKFQKKFSQFKSKKDLSPARKVDLAYAQYLIKLWLFELEELRLWETAPDMGTLVGQLIWQIFSLTDLKMKERCKLITARLKDIKGLAERAKTRVSEPYQLWIDMELETMTRLPSFFNTVKSAGRLALSVKDMEKLHNALEDTEDALDSYTNHLIEHALPRAVPKIGVGESAFKKMLKVRGLGMTLLELVNFGKKQLYSHKRNLKKLSVDIKKGATVLEVRGFIKSRHPSSVDESMNFSKSIHQKARKWATKNEFATLPDDDNLRVEQTPVYLRHQFPYGTYVAPAPLSDNNDGVYMITPGELRNERLREHNYASLTCMTLHETVPGHHLLLQGAASHESLIRKMYTAPEASNGWAHYAEGVFLDNGFENSLQNSAMWTLNQIWRTSQVIMDVELHCDRYTMDEALWFLLDETGMERQAAEIEINRYTRNPGLGLSFLVGKELYGRLRAKYKKKMGKAFSDLFFHDAILAAGPLPFPILDLELDWRSDERMEAYKEEAAALKAAEAEAAAKEAAKKKKEEDKKKKEAEKKKKAAAKKKAAKKPVKKKAAKKPAKKKTARKPVKKKTTGRAKPARKKAPAKKRTAK
jgi:hypothetical protein